MPPRTSAVFSLVRSYCAVAFSDRKQWRNALATASAASSAKPPSHSRSRQASPSKRVSGCREISINPPTASASPWAKPRSVMALNMRKAWGTPRQMLLPMGRRWRSPGDVASGRPRASRSVRSRQTPRPTPYPHAGPLSSHAEGAERRRRPGAAILPGPARRGCIGLSDPARGRRHPRSSSRRRVPPPGRAASAWSRGTFHPAPRTTVPDLAAPLGAAIRFHSRAPPRPPGALGTRPTDLRPPPRAASGPRKPRDPPTGAHR